MKTCRENLNLVKIGQKYPAIYLKAQARFTDACDIIRITTEVPSSIEKVSGCQNSRGGTTVLRHLTIV